MRAYPYAIENGAGERLIFERRVGAGDTERIEGGAEVAPGAGPPMHVHFLQDEGFTVLEGRLGYEVRGQPAGFAGAGETVVFPAGEPHRFWNAGDGLLRCSAFIEPAGNAEFFLGALFASQREHGGGRPSVWDAAYLTRRYRSEYALLVIPGLVQRILFPLVVMLGHVLGKYRRYANAPAPLAGAHDARPAR